jgi:hypothetical protein
MSDSVGLSVLKGTAQGAVPLVKIVLAVLVFVPLTSCAVGTLLTAHKLGQIDGRLSENSKTPEKPQTAAQAVRWRNIALDDISRTHRVERRGSTARIDRIAYGVPSGDQAIAALSFSQGDEARFHGNGFAGEAFRTMHVSGAHSITGPQHRFTTRYGLFNGRDLIIRDGARQRDCIVFVSAFDLPHAVISGFYCPRIGLTVSPMSIACMIDGIVFERAGLQPQLTRLADQSEQSASTCSSESQHTAPPRSSRRR